MADAKPKSVAVMSTRRPSQTFVVRLRPVPKVDAIKAPRAALKVLGRPYGLRAISITAEQESEKQSTLNV
jgi:hypothetical protein